MAEILSYDDAFKIAQRALEQYERAETKGEVEDIFIRYGRGGIGWKPLCRICFSKWPLKKALKVYIPKDEGE